MMSACMTFISLKLIREINWKFVSERDIISEDVYSLMSLYKYVKKVSIVSAAFYYYCENGDSLTRTYRKDRFIKVKHFYEKSLELSDCLGYGIEVKERLKEPLISNTITVLKHIAASKDNWGSKYFDIKKIIDDELLQAVLKNKNVLL